jgi:integrase
VTRRGRGENSIYPDGDRWRGSIDLGYDANGKRLRKKVSGRTRAEVAEKLDELRALQRKGMPLPNDKLTVEAFLDQWLAATVPGTVAPKTLDNYEDIARLYLKPFIGRKQLTKLTVDDANALWGKLRTAGYGANTIKGARSVLRKALGSAERQGLLLRNVAALSDPPWVDAEEGRSLSVAEAKRLLTEANRHRLGLAITLALIYGLRRGESLGLLWKNLDQDAGTLRLTHAVKRIKNRDPKSERKTVVVLASLKTRRSRRTLFLPPELVELLKDQRDKQAKERADLGEAWQELGLIFTSEVGTILDPDNFSRAFASIARRAKLGHWHVHEGRHSGASLMLGLGIDLTVVSEILGHASIAITKDIYGHLVEGTKRSAASSMMSAIMPERPSDDAEDRSGDGAAE